MAVGLLVAGPLALMVTPQSVGATAPALECAAAPISTTEAPATVLRSVASSDTSSTELVVPLPGPDPGQSGASMPQGSVLTEVLVLGRDGLGVARFCDDAEAAVDAMEAVLGPPDNDTGWAEPLALGACPGTVARRVTWGSLDLYFGDESSYASGRQHLYGYSYGDVDGFDIEPAGLATPEGIGPGTPVPFLQAAYPGVLLVAGEEGLTEPVFYVDESLAGLLTDVTDVGVVTLIVGGEDCGV
jgi:hypothetical protein